MSRAFVKEDAPEVPLVVPPRAPLPAGVPNYVTPAGLAALRAERAALKADRARLDAGDRADAAQQRERSAIAERLRALTERLAIAKLVDPAKVDRDDVRFGATVTLRSADGTERVLQIVGVDEAAAGDGKVAFMSPIARAVTGRRAGDVAQLQTPRGEDALEILDVRYVG